MAKRFFMLAKPKLWRLWQIINGKNYFIEIYLCAKISPMFEMRKDGNAYVYNI